MTKMLKTSLDGRAHHLPPEIVTTFFTASLRVPTSPDNRQLLRAMRAAELELWEHSLDHRDVSEHGSED